MQEKARIKYIDFLKFVGLTGIIIAHCGSPNLLVMLLSFDVPLMVILSSLLGEGSFKKYKNNELSVGKYFISRVKRLVIPTWIFLTLYFFISILITGKFQSIDYYIYSYFLTRYGFGYVWIFLIYLYSSLLIPLFDKINLSLKGVIIVVGLYILYEFMYWFQIGTNSIVINTTLFQIIPYGVLTYLGYNYQKMKRKTKIIISILSLLTFIILFFTYWYVNGQFLLVQAVKYPPRIYYLSYGVGLSFTLLLICEKYKLKIYENPLIRYVSIHSMWIYLWHILVLRFFGFLENWYIKLLIVYITTLLIVYFVNKILDLLEKNKKIHIFKYLRG